jgi:Domain of unknown function (DUF4136)
MIRLARVAVIAASGLFLAACAATMSVSSHVGPGVDFTHYRTYDWGPADALPTGDPRLDRNPFFQDHLQGAVEKGLAGLGFEHATAGTSPDLLIHYHASITQRINVNGVDSGYGYCYDNDCRERVVEYEAGTLVLDIVDAHTNQVIWRGWARNDVGDMLSNEDRMAQTIQEAVTRMLSRLPRRM